jgi:hypothetical protein
VQANEATKKIIEKISGIPTNKRNKAWISYCSKGKDNTINEDGSQYVSYFRGETWSNETFKQVILTYDTINRMRTETRRRSD